MSEFVEEMHKRVEIGAETTAKLKEIVTERTYRRGETISGMGDMRSHLYYVMSGSARVYFLSGGKEHTYSFAFENEMIVLSHVLLNDSNYVTTIEFLEPTRLAIIPFDEFRSIVRHDTAGGNTGVAEILFKALEMSFKALEERILVFQTLSAKERFEWLMQRYPKLLERANLTQIASYLGLTKETLYRIRSGKYR